MKLLMLCFLAVPWSSAWKQAMRSKKQDNIFITKWSEVLVFFPGIESLIQLVHVCACVHTSGLRIQMLFRSLFIIVFWNLCITYSRKSGLSNLCGSRDSKSIAVHSSFISLPFIVCVTVFVSFHCLNVSQLSIFFIYFSFNTLRTSSILFSYFITLDIVLPISFFNLMPYLLALAQEMCGYDLTRPEGLWQRILGL